MRCMGPVGTGVELAYGTTIKRSGVHVLSILCHQIYLKKTSRRAIFGGTSVLFFVEQSPFFVCAECAIGRGTSFLGSSWRVQKGPAISVHCQSFWSCRNGFLQFQVPQASRYVKTRQLSRLYVTNFSRNYISTNRFFQHVQTNSKGPSRPKRTHLYPPTRFATCTHHCSASYDAGPYTTGQRVRKI